MKYGLIGEKLGHSFSKDIHEILTDINYEITPIPRESIDAFMKAHDFSGINVTIPYKCTVIPYLDEIDEHAKKIGAVNAITNQNGHLKGYNTDYYGFDTMLSYFDVKPEGKKCVVLGSGGASKAICAVLKDHSPASVLTVGRQATDGIISYEDLLAHHTDAEIIVNTTPVGMFPHVEEAVIDLTPFSSCEAVLDIIYNPPETKLTEQAHSLGMKAATGFIMLIAQAKAAAEIFHNTHYDDAVIETIHDKLLPKLVK